MVDDMKVMKVIFCNKPLYLAVRTNPLKPSFVQQAEGTETKT